MPKRKRDTSADTEAGDVIPRAYDGAKKQRVQYKLKQGVVKVGHAFKLAKGFERQKLGRRQKAAVAENKEKDIHRINAEIAALKELDTTSSGRHHLYKTLAKIKAVAASEDLPKEVLQPKPLSTDAALLNVHARLCNSNAVKDALPVVLADVQIGLGIKVEDGKAVKKQRLRAKDYAQAASGGTGLGGKQQVKPPARAEIGSDSDAVEGAKQNGLQSDDEESTDDFEKYDDRLAPSDSDEEGGVDVGDIDDLERQLAAEGIRKTGASKQKGSEVVYDHAADLSLSEDAASVSHSPQPQKAPAPKKSSFLPSLTMGGYISGSGSDPESDIDMASRGNRRGQRARRAIAEKKYGQRAKHLQKANRNEGWDAKRGAVDGTEKRRGQRPGISKDQKQSKGAPAVAKGRPASDPKRMHRDDSGPVHPSWEAAKKAKEKKENGIAFAGKKTTFD